MADSLFEFKSKDFMKNGEDINIFKLRCKKDNSVHTHDFIELVYIAEGSGTEIIGGKSFYVKRGDLVFVNHGQTHGFTPDTSGMTYINIMLNLNFISEKLVNSDNAFEMLTLSAYDDIRDGIDTGINVVSFSGDELEEVDMVVDRCLAEYKQKKPAYIAVLKGYIGVLLAKMIRKMQLGGSNMNGVDIWTDIQAYINENLSEKLSLQQLAEKCFYNPSYFSRMFKEKYGITLKEYIINARINRAAELLKTTGASIECIAADCGFTGKSAFYKAFEKQFGITPLAYRSKY